MRLTAAAITQPAALRRDDHRDIVRSRRAGGLALLRPSCRGKPDDRAVSRPTAPTQQNAVCAPHSERQRRPVADLSDHVISSRSDDVVPEGRRALEVARLRRSRREHIDHRDGSGPGVLCPSDDLAKCWSGPSRCVASAWVQPDPAEPLADRPSPLVPPAVQAVRPRCTPTCLRSSPPRPLGEHAVAEGRRYRTRRPSGIPVLSGSGGPRRPEGPEFRAAAHGDRCRS